jgi:hypothetical protein
MLDELGLDGQRIYRVCQPWDRRKRQVEATEVGAWGARLNCDDHLLSILWSHLLKLELLQGIGNTQIRCMYKFGSTVDAGGCWNGAGVWAAAWKKEANAAGLGTLPYAAAAVASVCHCCIEGSIRDRSDSRADWTGTMGCPGATVSVGERVYGWIEGAGACPKEPVWFAGADAFTSSLSSVYAFDAPPHRAASVSKPPCFMFKYFREILMLSDVVSKTLHHPSGTPGADWKNDVDTPFLTRQTLFYMGILDQRSYCWPVAVDDITPLSVHWTSANRPKWQHTSSFPTSCKMPDNWPIKNVDAKWGQVSWGV